MRRPIRNLAGQRFGKLTAVEFVGVTHNGKAKWLCDCACGGSKTVVGRNLTRGHTSSCGCKLPRSGRCSESKEHLAWSEMLKRCRPTYGLDPHYHLIRVCDRWRSFANFLADMGPAPSPAHRLGRLNTRDHYRPGNCRWMTSQEQARLRRSNRIIEFRGQRRPLVEWSEISQRNYSTIMGRLNRGLTPAQALTR